jgi:hypothetical protein
MAFEYPSWEWWVWSIFSIVALILGIIAIADTNTVYNVRCFATAGMNTVPVPQGYTGSAVGCVEFGVSRLQVNLQWWMPLSLGIPTRITVRGPLTNGGVGNFDIAMPAVTICGANNTNTCSALESITCDEYDLAPGCGRLEVTITKLAPDDIPLTSQLPSILGFLNKARISPQLFYISVEHGATETSRGSLAQIGRVN